MATKPADLREWSSLTDDMATGPSIASLDYEVEVAKASAKARRSATSRASKARKRAKRNKAS